MSNMVPGKKRNFIQVLSGHLIKCYYVPLLLQRFLIFLQFWSLRGDRNSAQLFTSFSSVSTWAVCLSSGIQTFRALTPFKVIFQASLCHIGLVSPVNGRWFLRQVSQSGGEGLIPEFQGISSGLWNNLRQLPSQWHLEQVSIPPS